MSPILAVTHGRVTLTHSTQLAVFQFNSLEWLERCNSTLRTMNVPFSNAVALLCFGGLLGIHTAGAATLEKLSVEQMSQKATSIVRGRVTSCAGESRGSIIYTRCRVSVTERWKGAAGAELTFIIPGGSSQGLVQTFIGTPRFSAGQENVLFLWAGRSGNNQIIGLSQGVFDLRADGKGSAQALRSATQELMLDSSGVPTADEAMSVPVSALRSRVQRALAEAADR